MNDERFDDVIRTLRDGATRRGVLATVAGLAGLHVGDVAAKRRQRGRKRQGQAEGRLSAESRSQPVTIETVRGEIPEGTFTATGAIEDAGPFSFERVHFAAIGAPTFGIVPTLEVFEGEQGTFSLQNRIRFTFVAEDLLTIEGTWSVFKGTGAYERMHGHGTISGSITFPGGSEIVLETFTGTVHFD